MMSEAQEERTYFDRLKDMAEKGDAESQYAMGLYCLYDETNCKEAIFWLKQSAATGTPSHQFRLGYAYFCDGDYSEAEKWIRLSAERGERYAQVSLGTMYLHGTGVIKDEEEAIKWFRLAAKQGDKNAQFEVKNYNRRKAGLPEETEGCVSVTPSVLGAESEPISSKAIELQKLFEENGITLICE